MKTLGEYTYTQYIYQTAGKVGGTNVLASKAKAYLTYTDFNFLENNRDRETM